MVQNEGSLAIKTVQIIMFEAYIKQTNRISSQESMEILVGCYKLLKNVILHYYFISSLFVQPVT